MTGPLPFISVIIETYTVCHEYPPAEAGQQFSLVLDRLRRQSYPPERSEIYVVVDRDSQDLAAFVSAAYPEVKLTFVSNGTYFGMKNHGFDITESEIVALVDGDCVPCIDWLANIAAAFSNNPDVVAGKTRYRPEHAFAHTFSVFDFGHVRANAAGQTFAFNLNNVAFRRHVVRQHRLDERARRNGACYLLWVQLKQANYNMTYDPSVFAGHGNDFVGTGFIRKHVERGFDSIHLFRIADGGLLSGSRYVRLGVLVPFGMFAARLKFDLLRFISNRRDLGIRLYAIPYYCAASIAIRGLEAAGAMIAILKPDHSFAPIHQERPVPARNL